MAETTALIELKKVVDRYMFKYKLPDDDAANYFEHAADCVRDLNTHAISSYNQTTESVSSLGVLDMPTDMSGLIGVALPYKGELWYFTEKQFMIIKLTADDQMPTDYESAWQTYGTTGAKNLFYFRVDWKGRKIYIDGAEGEDVQLQYISSGLDLAAPTTVPAIATPAIDAYLRWAQGEIEGKSINEQLKRDRKYERQLSLLKVQSLPALREIKDYFLSMTTQAAQR
jgi:hypothetical protein